MNWNNECNLTSLPDLTDVIVSEWDQKPAFMFQSLYRRSESVTVVQKRLTND